MDKAVASGLEGPWFDPCLRLFIFFFFSSQVDLNFKMMILTIMFRLTYVIVNFIIQKLKTNTLPSKNIQTEQN